MTHHPLSWEFCIWRRWVPLSTLICIASAVALPSILGQSREVGYVTVRLAAVTPRLDAYGQIEPIAVLPVNAAEGGVVAGLKVLPGMHVRAGQELAHLNGPQIAALLLQSRADVRSAQAQRSASQKSLAIQRQELASHLSTRQAVQQAESAAAQARTALDNAQSHLKSVRRMMTLTAPANGTVLTLNAADGELISAGQPILTLQTANGIWLRATYYGAAFSAIHVGMTGVFSPSGGGQPIPVRVRSVLGALTPGGGESIALVPARSRPRLPPGWRSGEFGTVVLHLPKKMLVAVPTRALILDQGEWWVMVHTSKGDHPQAVVPGPSRGWRTFLESGLKPGAQVVVENAYLLFHRGISGSYQVPDE